MTFSNIVSFDNNVLMPLMLFYARPHVAPPLFWPALVCISTA